ncbi:MAG: TrbI/VirB10 family protein [Acidobacteriia bacterium]|nr:TrbI/VirB10 family protein [Terriglobia bacterium]
MRWAIVVVLLGTLAAAQQVAEEREGNRGGWRAGITVPAGTQIPLKLAQGISTKSAKVGDAVYAQTVFPITANDRIVIPAGTYVQGRISDIKRPGRVKGRAEFLMHFTTMIFHSGYTVMLPGAVDNLPGSEKQTVRDKEGTIQQDGTKGKDAGTVAKTAGEGAVVGAIVDRGIRGAGIGGGAGAAVGLASVLLTRGPDVHLPAGTSVLIVLERPLSLDGNKIR